MEDDIYIVGAGRTAMGKLGRSPFSLMEEALRKALNDARLLLGDIDGLIVTPPLADQRLMPAHTLAAQLGISTHLSCCTSIDTGGAGPVSAVLLASRLIKQGVSKTVAVVAADSLSTLEPGERLRRMNAAISHPNYPAEGPTATIPTLYDRIAQWHMNMYGTTREQLAMVPVLMSRQAMRHPDAANKKELTLDEVLASKTIAPVTNMFECARPVDGGGALIITSFSRGARARARFPRAIEILGGGEGAGLPYPPELGEISESIFSGGRAAATALSDAGMSIGDIGWWGIYDCFPICFLKFVESVGLAPQGEGGKWIEERYHAYQRDSLPDEFPFNTHGGLLSFGAPWEAPAMFSIIEAVEQIRGEAGERQVTDPSPALVYGNGGILSSSAVVVLG